MALVNYTPKTPEDIVFACDATRDLVLDLISGKTAFPAYGRNGIILYGTYGTGKSTLAAMLPDAIEMQRGGTKADARIEKVTASNNGADLFASGLWIALPMVAMLMFVNLAMGIVSRVAPQMNIYAIGFPLTLSVGLIAITVTLPMLDQPMMALMERAIDLFSKR